MDSDANLPSSPPHTSALQSSPFPHFFEPQRSTFISKSSSPPPVFSSDDSRESVDVTNYQSPRIYKNKRKGTWWDNRESAHTTPEMKRTKFSRNFDSGIYMHSDATDSSDDILPQHKSPFAPDMDFSDDAIDTGDAHEQNTGARASKHVAMTISAAGHAFNDQIEEGLGDNLQRYDFEGQSLCDSDISRIGDLKHVIRNPPVYDNELPTEGQFRSLEPELCIILNRNQLRQLTPALFDLTYLTSLSLRENQIEEIPQDICRLRNLQMLDVARNKLKYLPFDIIHLLQPHGSLERLTTIGNELLEPMSYSRFNSSVYIAEEEGTLYTLDALPLDLVRDDAKKQLAHLYDNLATFQDRDQAVWRIRYFESWANSFDGGDDARECDVDEDLGFYPHHPSLNLRALDDHDVMARAPRYIARTLVSYYDQCGARLSKSQSPSLPTSDQDQYSVIIETNRGTYGVPPSNWFEPASSSKVFPLVTASLHKALRLASIEEISNLATNNGAYEIPTVVETFLHQAEENSRDGYSVFRRCHTCSREYVVARAEWVEFWSFGPFLFLPLKVSVCTWGCVPPQIMQEPKRQLQW
ncbi:leucine rich repeat domain [Pyrenophora seminiperda CCB06]|uniref:Leucine rich repeat domain n=1 Tax=Pyrenophora seminiperda CCB06 TaxID=1302712 RepID=A0A3M7MHI6_9PLEO|nr:leucine rich repeat domain [Pyrenophora seminiperda CCB06]